MRYSRQRFAATSVLLAVLALLLTAAPATASPADPARPARVLAQPEGCEAIEVNADGAIVGGKHVITSAQLEDLDNSVAAFLSLAADLGAGAEWLCVAVEVDGEVVTVTGALHVCAATSLNREDDVEISGARVDPALLNPELLAVLRGFAAIGEDACLSVTVAGDVEVFVEADGCVTATLNENGSLSVKWVGEALEIPAEAIAMEDVPLDVGVPTESQLSIIAALTLPSGEFEIQAAIGDPHFCVSPTAGQVVVEKRINPDPGSGPGERAAGWVFSFRIEGETASEQFDATDEDGIVVFDYTVEPGAVITIAEERRPGYELVDFVCQPISDGGEPLAPVGEWTDFSVTFPAEPGVRTACVFLNAPTAPVPTTAPTAPTVSAPTATPRTGGQAAASGRPTLTLPPTDVRVSRAHGAAPWPTLLLATLGFVSGVALLLAVRGMRRGGHS